MRAVVHETYAAELAWLAGQVAATHDTMAEPSWREIGVLTRDNAQRGRRLRRPDRGGHPGRDRRPPGAAAAARGGRGGRHADPAARPDRERRPAHPAHRAALGDRAARPRAAGPARPRAGRRRGRTHPAGDRRPARCGGRRRRPDRGQLAVRRPRRPGRRPLLRRPHGSGSRCCPPSCGCCARTWASPCSTWSARSSTPPASTSSWPPRSARPPRARRDNLDLFVKAVAEFQAVDGAVSLAALLAYLTAEDEMGTGLDIATPTEADSVKLLTVHRAKGLEWDAVFCVGVCEERFPTTRTRTLWPNGPAVLPSPLRGDAADLPQLRGPREGRPGGAQGRVAHARGAGGAAAGLRRLHPRRGTCCGSPPTCGTSPARPRSAPRRTR